MNTLFLAWQDQAGTRRWFVIGRLDRTGEGYQFQYVNQVHTALSHGFQLLPEFEFLEDKYQSNRLFPLFENRLLSRARPDYAEFLDRLALSAQDDDPMNVLARTEGLRTTDSFEVFPKPEPDPDGNYHLVFFARGVRHLPSETEEFIQSLHPGDRLDIIPDTGSEFDCNALLMCGDGTKVGWVPRYLCPDVKRLESDAPQTLDVRVERVNPAPAPVQQRLLCSLTAPWPSSWEPFSDEEFQGVFESTPPRRKAS